jgi:hypothetical protein
VELGQEEGVVECRCGDCDASFSSPAGQVPKYCGRCRARRKHETDARWREKIRKKNARAAQRVATVSAPPGFVMTDENGRDVDSGRYARWLFADAIRR